MTTVDLYSANHCSLCTEAKEILLRLQKEKPFLLKEIKIRPTDVFFEQFKHHIPVIFIDSKESVSGKISEQQLRKLLNIEM